MSVAERGRAANNPAGRQVGVVLLRYFVAVRMHCEGTNVRPVTVTRDLASMPQTPWWL